MDQPNYLYQDHQKFNFYQTIKENKFFYSSHQTDFNIKTSFQANIHKQFPLNLSTTTNFHQHTLTSPLLLGFQSLLLLNSLISIRIQNILQYVL
jgi:hypothetical protein